MTSHAYSFTVGGLERPTDPGFEKVVVAYMRGADKSRRSLVRDRARVRRDVRKRYGRVVEDMFTLHDGATEAVNWAGSLIDDALDDSDEDVAFREYHLLLRGLAAQSLLTFDEVTCLVENGHRHGALARVRTMYELFVVAMVIGLHGNPSADHPELVDRFLRHNEAFYRSQAGALLLAGTDGLDGETLSALDAHHSELVDEYGKAFTRGWGWAAPLFPPGKPVSFGMLVDLVEPAFAFFYPVLSESVHAGSDRWHSSLEDVDGEGVFRAYADAEGLEFAIELSTQLLLAIVDTVVPTRVESEDTSETADETGATMLAALRHRRDAMLDAVRARRPD